MKSNITLLIWVIALYVLGSGLSAFGLLLITTMLMAGSEAWFVSTVIGLVLVVLGTAILYDASRTIFKGRSNT